MTSNHTFRWQIKFLAILTPFVFLLIAEMVLRIFGILPPDDPLLFFLKTQEKSFSPFIETVDGQYMMRPDWTNDGEILASRRGSRPGRLYCDPGFRPTHFHKKKAKNTIRIFVLGGSTVFGLLVGSNDTFPSVLARQLESVFDTCEVEVINLGCPGLSSSRVLNLVNSLLSLKPDLIIIYSGHNEFLHSNLSDLIHRNFFNTVKVKLLSYSKTFGWFNFLISSMIRSHEYDYQKEEVAAIEAGKILMIELDRVPVEQQNLDMNRIKYEKTITAYSKNIKAMVSRAKKAIVPILLLIPVSNLLYPPFISNHVYEIERPAKFKAHFDNAFHFYRKGNLKKALSHINSSLEISSQFAQARYLRELMSNVVYEEIRQRSEIPLYH